MFTVIKKALVICFLGCFPLFSQNVLRVGMELSYPPFEMIDKEGKPCGISVEIAESLGRFSGKTIQIENIAFVGLIPSLKSHKIDLIISSMSVTEERKQAIDFSDPYLKIGLCLLISKESTVSSIENADKAGKVIVVKQGTTGQIYAQKNIKEATVLVLDKESACVTEVVQGKADAFIYDQISVFTNWQKNKDTTRALLNPFAIEAWAVGICKDRPQLKEEVNRFISIYRDSEEFQTLKDKYLSEQKAALQKLGIELYL